MALIRRIPLNQVVTTGTVTQYVNTGTFATTGAVTSFVNTGTFATTGAVTNYVNTGTFPTTGQVTNYVSTSKFVSTGQTGHFLDIEYSGYAKNLFVTTGNTGIFITASQTGAFAPSGSYVFTNQTGNFASLNGGYLNQNQIPLFTGDISISAGTNSGTVTAIQGYQVSTQLPVNGQMLQWDGSAWVPGSVAAGGNGGGGLVYYFNETVAADLPTGNLPNAISGVYELGRSGMLNQFSFTTPELPENDYTGVVGFITDVLDPHISEIPAGLFDFNFWASSNSATQTIVKLEVYKYDGVTTTATLLASSDDIYTYDGVVIAQYIASIVLPQTNISSTDRLYIRYLAKGLANNKNITFYFGGNTPSHVHTTFSSVGGSGLVKVINGIYQNPASKLVNSDVDDNAQIAASKIQSGIFALVSNTGNFVTASQTGQFAPSGSYVFTTETGNFVTASQTGNFVTASQTGQFAPSGSYVFTTETGNFVTASQTGQFAPSGSYVFTTETGNFVTASQTGNFVTASQTGQFAPSGSYVFTTETGNFVTASQTGNFVTASQTGQFAPSGSYVFTTETGNFVTASQTGNFVTASQTGQFAITGNYITNDYSITNAYNQSSNFCFFIAEVNTQGSTYSFEGPANPVACLDIPLNENYINQGWLIKNNIVAIGECNNTTKNEYFASEIVTFIKSEGDIFTVFNSACNLYSRSNNQMCVTTELINGIGIRYKYYDSDNTKMNWVSKFEIIQNLKST